MSGDANARLWHDDAAPQHSVNLRDATDFAAQLHAPAQIIALRI